MPSISYAITACNEHIELFHLLHELDGNLRDEDEVVIQLDVTATEDVREITKKFPSFTVIEFPLNRDFASFKNNLKSYCTKDYIFQIDADEYPHPELMENLPAILENNPEIDVFLVPRINTVEGLTEAHIARWGWRVQEGRVNFPDYQWRIWKNEDRIRWINRVHERLDGFGLYVDLPPIDEMCLFHPKEITRQERQNNYYDTI